MSEVEKNMYEDMKAKTRERENDAHFFRGFCTGTLFATLAWFGIEFLCRRFGM